MFEAEERRDTLVIVGFVALIVLLVVGIVAALALNYYDHNIRPLAPVGATEVGPTMVRDRTGSRSRSAASAAGTRTPRPCS